MTTKTLTAVSLLLTSVFLGYAGENESAAILASKTVGTSSSRFRYELRRQPFTQTIEADTNIVTRRGFLVEMTKGPPAETTPQGVGTNLVWSMFFIKGLDPREKWTGDFAVGSSPDDLFLVVSSGTSFGVFKLDARQIVARVPDRVGRVLPSEAGSARTWLARPSAEMLVTMPQIDAIHLIVQGDILVIDVVSPEHQIRQYRFSLVEKRWMEAMDGDEARLGN